MKQIKIEGIVLTETNYSESSKILNIYTKNLGILSVISKGCRKIKSILRSSSNKLTYAYFIINYKENGLSTLINADIIDSFKNIMTDIIKISYATYLLELSYQVAKESDNSNIFNLLITSLKKIDIGFDPHIISLIVEIKYLRYLGIDINVDSCCICGSTSDIVTINVDKGGYICRNCYSNEKIISNKAIKLIRIFYYVDVYKISKLSLNDTTIKEITKFLEDYYDKYSGLYLKSKNFLKQII
ncbi:MAG: DNA repair protein RecO [bacterium]|nr:DNA repair protein RecO [bacterium]